MPGCSVKGCTNYDQKHNKKDNISYHRFPRDPVRNEAWCRIIRQQRAEPYFKSNRYLRICSAHFTADDFYMMGTRRLLKKMAIPSVNVQPLFPDINPPPEIKHETLDTDVTNSEDDLNDVDISDMESIFDTPRKVKLKQEMKKYMQLNIKKTKKIKLLQRQNTRLKKKNKSLMNIIKELKSKRLFTCDIETALEVTPTITILSH